MDVSQEDLKHLEEINKAAAERMEREGYGRQLMKEPFLLLSLCLTTLSEVMDVDPFEPAVQYLVRAQEMPDLCREVILRSELEPEEVLTEDVEVLAERFVHLFGVILEDMDG